MVIPIKRFNCGSGEHFVYDVMALSIDTGVQQFCAFIDRLERTNNGFYVQLGIDIDWELNLLVANGNEVEAKYALHIFLLYLLFFENFVLVNGDF